MNNLFTLNQIQNIQLENISTGIFYLDNILGEGLVQGSTVLFAGTTGAGKSTLSTQFAYNFSQQNKVFYMAGEESKEQIKKRAIRLGIDSSNIYLFENAELEKVTESLDILRPKIAIMDSMQMLYSSSLKNPIGTPSQIRYCLLTLCRFAKEKNISIIFIGHSTKEGYIAGLQSLQHAVDVILFLKLNEDKTRTLQATKNRFGSTEPSYVLYMTKYGLFDYPNPTIPYGQTSTLNLTEEQINQLTRSSFFRPIILFSIFWLKEEVKKEIEYGNNTFTLTSSLINKITENHPIMKPIVNFSLNWLKKEQVVNYYRKE